MSSLKPQGRDRRCSAGSDHHFASASPKRRPRFAVGTYPARVQAFRLACTRAVSVRLLLDGVDFPSTMVNVGVVLAAGGGLFVRTSNSRSRLGALAHEAAGDHQNCAVKFNWLSDPSRLKRPDAATARRTPLWRRSRCQHSMDRWRRWTGMPVSIRAAASGTWSFATAGR